MHIKIKDIKLKWIIPLEIVKSLNGKGVKPAVNNIPNQAVNPPPAVKFSLNVSEYSSFELNIDGQGRTFKFAVACEDDLLGLTEFIPGGLRWIKSFPTKKLKKDIDKE